MDLPSPSRSKMYPTIRPSGVCMAYLLACSYPVFAILIRPCATPCQPRGHLPMKMFKSSTCRLTRSAGCPSSSPRLRPVATIAVGGGASTSAVAFGEANSLGGFRCRRKRSLRRSLRLLTDSSNPRGTAANSLALSQPTHFRLCCWIMCLLRKCHILWTVRQTLLGNGPRTPDMEARECSYRRRQAVVNAT